MGFRNLSSAEDTTYNFLSGAGEMGQLIRAFNWSKTPVGPVESWPQSLRTTVSIMLHSRFPMFLFWGDDLICFYNDAYRPSLGNDGKHPSALGQKAEIVWPEIWPLIKPIIDQVLSGGEANWNENQLLPIYRNGKLEDVYWTFSYSAAYDETGKVGGVFVTCTETTEAVNAAAKQKLANERFQNLVREAPIGIVVLTGEQMQVDIVNQAYCKLIGQQPGNVLNQNLFDIIPETRDYYYPIINKVRATGEPVFLYDSPYTIGKGSEQINGYLNVVYQPYREAGGNVTGVMVLCQDVTGNVAERKRLEERELFASKIIHNSVTAQCIWEGYDMVFTMVNEKMLEIFGRDSSIIGTKYMDAIPELKDTPLLSRLRHVLTTGETFIQPEEEFTLMRHGKPYTGYYTYNYQVLANAAGKNYGVICICTEITEQVTARRQMQEMQLQSAQTAERLQLAIQAGELGSFELDLSSGIIDCTEQCKINCGFAGAGAFTYTALMEAMLPDDKDAFERNLQQSIDTNITFKAEYRTQWADSPLRWVRAAGRPVYDRHGKAVKMVGITINITEQKLFALQIEEREKHFRTLADSIQNLAWMADGEGNIFWYNKRWYEYTGSTLEEMKGWGWQKVHHPDHVNKVLEFIRVAWNTPEPFELTFPLRSRDGEYRWFLTRVTPVMNEDGTIYRWIGTNTDIHDQKIAEDRFRTLAESLPQLVWMADNQGNYIYASGQWQEYSGLDPYESGNWQKIVHPDDWQVAKDWWDNSMATGTAYTAEMRLRNKEGAYRWHSVQGEPIYNDEDAIINWIGAFTDIDAQKTAAQKLEGLVDKRTTELRRSNEDLQQFAYVTSHDLKEPVRKIKVFSNLLEEKYGESLADGGKVLVDKIQSGANRMMDMIEGILKYSSINFSEEQITSEIDLNEVFENIGNDLELLLEQKEAGIKINGLGTIQGVPLLIFQLFYNLIHNALKFSRNEQPVNIKIDGGRTEIDGQLYQKVVITDNGIGFEKEYEDKIFNTFTRLHSKDTFEGTGLGLALCKKIVERHRGTITARGIENEGAEFTILLPVVQQQGKI